MTRKSLRRAAVWSAAGLVALCLALLSGTSRAETCSDPMWSGLDGTPRQLCTLLLLEDPPVARSDCASTLLVSGEGGELVFDVEGIGAARYRVLDGDAEGASAANMVRSAAACHGDPACLVDPEGAISERLAAVADDPASQVTAEASINLREVLEEAGTGLFGDTDDVAPPNGRLTLVRVGAGRVLVLQTSLGPFDGDMSGPTSMAVLDQDAEAALCRG